MQNLERVLVVHQDEDLKSYTSTILTELGFRHVLTATSLSSAKLTCEHSLQRGHPIQLIVCDDALPEGALVTRRELRDWPCVVVTDSHNPNNVRLAAALGVTKLLFRPYGKAQMAKVLGSINLT
jgi:CheY-like chemotaxis protein